MLVTKSQSLQGAAVPQNVTEGISWGAGGRLCGCGGGDVTNMPWSKAVALGHGGITAR
jgi:hypothetical protein